MIERRQSRRHGYRTALALVRDGEPARGEALDISGGGLRVTVTGDPLVVGEVVRVTFSLPELDAPISVDAEVRWVDRVDVHTGGLQFREGLRAREVWAIERLGSG